MRAENFLATQMREMKLLLTGGRKRQEENFFVYTIRTVPESKLSTGGVANDFLET